MCLVNSGGYARPGQVTANKGLDSRQSSAVAVSMAHTVYTVHRIGWASLLMLFCTRENRSAGTKWRQYTPYIVHSPHCMYSDLPAVAPPAEYPPNCLALARASKNRLSVSLTSSRVMLVRPCTDDSIEAGVSSCSANLCVSYSSAHALTARPCTPNPPQRSPGTLVCQPVCSFRVDSQSLDFGPDS